jgi:hypothetical protein
MKIACRAGFTFLLFFMQLGIAALDLSRSARRRLLWAGTAGTLTARLGPTLQYAISGFIVNWGG